MCVSREVEVGRDVFNCCVCASPVRDMENGRKKLQGYGQPRKRKRSIYTCTCTYIHVYVHTCMLGELSYYLKVWAQPAVLPR